jgi:hypothetical protein
MPPGAGAARSRRAYSAGEFEVKAKISIRKKFTNAWQAKEKGGSTFAARPIHQVVTSLEAGDVRCLQALGALGHFELNGLAVVQGLITVRLNGGEVDENIFARLALNESESLAGIEPLNSSLFSQLNSLFFF